MKPWGLMELWCSVPELTLGFRLERSFPGTPRLLETPGILQQLPQVGSHPQGAAPAVPGTVPMPVLWAVVALLSSPASGTLFTPKTLKFLLLGIRKE